MGVSNAGGVGKNPRFWRRPRAGCFVFAVPAGELTALPKPLARFKWAARRGEAT